MNVQTNRWPGLEGLGLVWEAWARGPGGTDVRTDGQNIPCILQNIAPLGPLPKKDYDFFLTAIAGFMVPWMGKM